MKIVVQNGSRHCLSRKDVEAVLGCLPESWGFSISRVILAKGDELKTTFHAKERVLALYCPWEPEGQRDRTAAIAILVTGLAQAARSEFPDELIALCQEAVAAGTRYDRDKLRTIATWAIPGTSCRP